MEFSLKKNEISIFRRSFIFIKNLFLYVVLILSLFLFTGATCSPISPPSITPSRSLKVQDEGSKSVSVYGGLGGQIFDTGGHGIGLEASLRLKDDTGLSANIIGATGEELLENDYSLFGIGTGLIKYIGRLNSESYLMAFEPRMDIMYLTNGTLSSVPNFNLHISYFLLKFLEGRLTLRSGASLVVSRGDEINVSKSVSDSVYTKSCIMNTIYVGGDIGCLFHYKNSYIGPSFGLLYTHTTEKCYYCSDEWFYLLLNTGISF